MRQFVSWLVVVAMVFGALGAAVGGFLVGAGLAGFRGLRYLPPVRATDGVGGLIPMRWLLVQGSE
jgi:hypothetical protein